MKNNTRSNKKIDRPTLMRIIYICLLILLDIILVPWIVKFPSFLIKDFSSAPAEWFEYGIVNSYKELFSENADSFRRAVLFMQLPVAALILALAWNTDRLKKKNRIKDGIGGPEPAGHGQYGTGRWQTKREMDKSAAVWYTDKPLKKGGVIIGMEKSNNGREKVWLNDSDLHTLIIGSTRSGKDRRVLLPSIWTIAKSGESMVISDPKGDMYLTTKHYLESLGYNIIAMNFRDPTKGNRWNLLEQINKAIDKGNVPEASEMAWDIASTIVKQNPPSNADPIWEKGEQSVIASLVLLTALNSEFKFQRHMATAYYLLAEFGQPVHDDSIPFLEYMRRLPIKHPAKAAFATASIAPYKTRASFFTQTLTDLRLFADPNIADMTAVQDHNFDDISLKKTAVFLVIPHEKSTRNVLATIYIDQLYQSLITLANNSGGRLPRRVNFLLNEFGNLPAIMDFDKKLTVAAGFGIRFALAVQDIAQIKKLYKDNAQTITGNCHNWIFIKTADVDTAKLISEKTGKYTIESENLSSSIQSKGHSSSYGVGFTGRPLLMPDEVLRWNIDESLVLPLSNFPARYPLPDLSYWNAINDFGLSNTGNVDLDIKRNSEILLSRWESMPVRNVQDVSVWLPDLSEIYGDDNISVVTSPGTTSIFDTVVDISAADVFPDDNDNDDDTYYDDFLS